MFCEVITPLTFDSIRPRCCVQENGMDITWPQNQNYELQPSGSSLSAQHSHFILKLCRFFLQSQWWVKTKLESVWIYIAVPVLHQSWELQGLWYVSVCWPRNRKQTMQRNWEDVLTTLTNLYLLILCLYCKPQPSHCSCTVCLSTCQNMDSVIQI